MITVQTHPLDCMRQTLQLPEGCEILSVSQHENNHYVHVAVNTERGLAPVNFYFYHDLEKMHESSVLYHYGTFYLDDTPLHVFADR